MEQKLKYKRFFLAVITDKFLAKSETYLKICSDVAEQTERATMENRTEDLKPMFVAVKDGVDWGEFQQFPWRNIYSFDTEEDFDRIWEEMRGDIKCLNLIQTM